MHKGHFHMGPVIGMIVNVIAVAWIIFAIVFFSFPYYKPVTGMFPLQIPGNEMY